MMNRSRDDEPKAAMRYDPRLRTFDLCEAYYILTGSNAILHALPKDDGLPMDAMMNRRPRYATTLGYVHSTSARPIIS